MKINREQFAEETKLRNYVRQVINIVENRRKMAQKEQISEEKRLRGYVRHLIKEAGVPDSEDAPHRATGINILEDLLKKIIPLIEIDFKKLTTSEEQRSSYRSHMIQGTKNLLAPPRVTDDADLNVKASEEFISIKEQENDVKISVDPENEHQDDFIDISGEKKEKKSPDEVEKETFSIEGTDETGRDMAFVTFKKIQGSILDSWDVLSNDEDKELFYDYLLTNLKLYFDKFEDELKATIPEPTTPEYEEATAAETGEQEEEL